MEILKKSTSKLYLCTVFPPLTDSSKLHHSSPPRRALRVRKKMSGDRMPVKMIGDILTNQLPHMQPYIRFCCPLLMASLISEEVSGFLCAKGL